jgi:lyso-ornithine lipid O-acyltransferase
MPRARRARLPSATGLGQAVRPMRSALRLTLLALATLLVAPLQALAIALCLGARGPSARAGALAMHAWALLACRALGVRVRLEGRSPEGPCLLAANHLSYLDILVLGACYPGLFLSMAEVGRWPLVGGLSRLVGTLFIDRGRASDSRRAVEAMAERLRLGLRVTLFPEGRASSGRGVGRFHSALLEAAIAAGAPCVPVALGYDAPPPAEPALQVCWWGEMTFLPHFRALLGLTGVEARVRLGAPLPAEGDRKALARALEARVRESFVPVRQPPAAGAAP